MPGGELCAVSRDAARGAENLTLQRLGELQLVGDGIWHSQGRILVEPSKQGEGSLTHDLVCVVRVL